MRIGYFTTLFPYPESFQDSKLYHRYPVGGAEVYAYNLACHMVKLGHEVIVFTTSIDSKSHVEEFEGMKIYRCATNLKIETARFSLDMFCKSLQHDVDIIHVHYTIPYALHNMHGAMGDKIAARREFSINEPFVILYFGMIRKEKRVPNLIQAFNALPESVAKSSRLIIAGEDWKDDVVIRDVVQRSPYQQQITFDDRFIPNELVPKYFAAADLVAFTHSESCGSGSCSLAMAYGKQIIAPDLVIMRELSMGYDGITFFPPGNNTEITKLLVEFHTAKVQGREPPIYEPPATGWEKVTRRYDEIINRLILKQVVPG